MTVSKTKPQAQYKLKSRSIPLFLQQKNFNIVNLKNQYLFRFDLIFYNHRLVNGDEDVQLIARRFHQC